MSASANTPSACLSNVFGQQFATQLVASCSAGSPTSQPRAKLARPASNDTGTGPRNTRRRPCGTDGSADPQPYKPKDLFQSGAGDPDYQAAIADDEETVGGVSRKRLPAAEDRGGHLSVLTSERFH